MPTSSRGLPGVLWWLVGAIVLALGVSARLDAGVWAGDEIVLQDPDTLRRLVRLAAIDDAVGYPVVETKDGYPQGSVLHWTLPMDWLLRGLDPLARLVLPQARRYEAGAVLIGPLLGALSILVMLVGARRLLGRAAALLVGLAYAFAYAPIEATRLGNADHQSLQHLVVLGSVLLGSIALHEQRSGAAVGSGVLAGLSVWVTAESMLVVYAMVAVVAGLSLGERQRSGWASRARLGWSVGLVAVLALGHVVEHRSDVGAFEYDTVSWLQLWQGLVVVAFALAMRALPFVGARRALIAASIALALGLVPLVASGVLRGALAAEHARLSRVDAWLRGEVVEFWSLAKGGLGLLGTHLFVLESWLVLALPLCLVGLWLKGPAPALSAAWTGLAVCLLGLEIWEQKLAHLFALVFPLVLVAGGIGLVSRWVRGSGAVGRAVAWALAAVLLVWSATLRVPPSPSQRPHAASHAHWLHLCETLREQADRQPPGAVLAPWQLGAPILYHAGLPVVASGYHRNLDGILDGHRVFLAGRDQREEAWRILRARQVRFVVATYDAWFLKFGAETLGRLPLAEWRAGGFVPNREGRETLWFELRSAMAVAGMRLVANGPLVVVGGRNEPVYRIWAVLP